MKLDKIVLGLLALISLFLGFVLVVALIGNIFPSIHKLSASLICRDQVQLETIKYSYKPGEMGWYHYVYCVDDSGTKKDISGLSVLITGLVSSAIIFLFFAIRSRNKLFSLDTGSAQAAQPGITESPTPRKKKSGSGLERLTELKQMRDANLISEAEYEEKKAEIMDSL